jgi:hypothetical protein
LKIRLARSGRQHRPDIELPVEQSLRMEYVDCGAKSFEIMPDQQAVGLDPRLIEPVTGEADALVRAIRDTSSVNAKAFMGDISKNPAKPIFAMRTPKPISFNQRRSLPVTAMTHDARDASSRPRSDHPRRNERVRRNLVSSMSCPAGCFVRRKSASCWSEIGMAFSRVALLSTLG